MTRTDIINRYIGIFQYGSYLEIGAYDGKNFAAINCLKKVSVDPDPKATATFKVTSDQFFAGNKNKWDIIFIDGLHHSEQVKRDIENSLNCLNDNGTIIVHDCNPTSEEMQNIPRATGIWTGDVWRAWAYYRQFVYKRSELISSYNMFVLDTDYGVGVIRKNRHIDNNTDINIDLSKITYNEFTKDKKHILNLIPAEPEPISICVPAFEQYGWGVVSLRHLFNSMIDLKGTYEIVISDNANNNTIEKLCHAYQSKLPIRYHKHTVRGTSENINNAMSKAKYNIIKPMFQDDIFINNDALIDIAFALKDTSISWVLCSGHSINDRNRLGKYRVPEYTPNVLSGLNTVGMPSVIAHRKTDIIYDVNLKTRIDCEFYWLMGTRYGYPEVIKKPLIGSRYWKQSTSSKQGSNTPNELPYLLKKHNLTQWP